jgi:hypothetical protein
MRNNKRADDFAFYSSFVFHFCFCTRYSVHFRVKALYCDGHSVVVPFVFMHIPGSIFIFNISRAGAAHGNHTVMAYLFYPIFPVAL